MTEYNDRMCEKCEEKETCEDYKYGIEHGFIPFGCSNMLSDMSREDMLKAILEEVHDA